MTPIVDGLAAEFMDEIEVTRLNAATAENARLQQQWGLRGHPSFAVLDSRGNLAQTFLGPQSEDELRRALVAVLALDGG